ncbi:hypothetical protein GXP67_19620 [Rhodocytophaga rosea]|uniref:Uncharacterized protein n=1 Tax=Rhodocytophaga rosea TaxID=2704465 RepID=A0A6C0GL10_9BACT|nr:hypothetical protein [Rhodocytophaga rosea]QHT68695.1 hypothetical protein GXP67_19620 [Rhodocytophaga rosea]
MHNQIDKLVEEREIKYLDDYENDKDDDFIESEDEPRWTRGFIKWYKNEYGFFDEFDLDSDSFKNFISNEDLPDPSYKYSLGEKVLYKVYIGFGIQYWPAEIINIYPIHSRYEFEIRINDSGITEYRNVEEFKIVPHSEMLEKKMFDVDNNRVVIKVINNEIKVTRKALQDTIDSMENELQYFHYDDRFLDQYSFKSILIALKLKFKHLKIKHYLGEEPFAKEWWDGPLDLF